MNRAFKNDKIDETSPELKLMSSHTDHDAGFPVYIAWYVAGLAALIVVLAST